MTELKLKPRSRALVVVAHPDDETIWLGGTIMLNPGVRWTVLCLSRASDADRAPKFRRVMRRLGVRGVILDLPDDMDRDATFLVPRIKRAVVSALDGRRFDQVFTHGANGEYGHPLHKAAHQAVKGLRASGKLSSLHLLYFNYRKDGRRMAAKKDSDLSIPLDKKTFQEKKRIVAEMYGYPWDGIDVGLCTRVEAFKRLKNKTD